MESPVLIPDVMDSHMHLDRSLRRLRLDPSTGIQEFLTQCPAPAPKQQINLVGVLVYCDPKSWPKVPEKFTFLYTEGLSSLTTVHPHLTQGSHSRGVHQLGQAIKIVIAKVTGQLWMYSHRYNPSLGEMQLLWDLRP
jgi:hypothetical protein